MIIQRYIKVTDTWIDSSYEDDYLEAQKKVDELNKDGTNIKYRLIDVIWD